MIRKKPIANRPQISNLPHTAAAKAPVTRSPAVPCKEIEVFLVAGGVVKKFSLRIRPELVVCIACHAAEETEADPAE
jgi:hypothetical protein